MLLLFHTVFKSGVSSERRYPIAIPRMPISRLDISIPDDILTRPREERIQLAVAMIQDSGKKPNGDPQYSARQAEQDFGIPRSSLGRRLQGICGVVYSDFMLPSTFLGGKSRREAHVGEQLLTEAQEEILAKWVKIQGRRGIPMTYASVMQCASAISGKQTGGSWPKRFCKRHPNLKMKRTTGLEKARAKALNQFAVNGFFDMLTDVMQEFNILPENLYNMDEKGLQLGIGARITAMIDRDQQTVYSIEDGNRELVTVIETICADGSVLHPSVIFQGQRRNSEWGRNNPCNARFASLMLKYRSILPIVGTAYPYLQMVGLTKSWALHGFGTILILQHETRLRLWDSIAF